MGLFAAGAMLLWGGVAAVPIILHLLRRRRRRTVRWGAMRFLSQAVARRAQRFQLWRWLLLALRVLAIALLAIALARPVMRAGDGAVPEAARSSVLRVLVLDASYSMTAVAGGRTRFEIARRAAADLVGAAGAGDGFSLVRMDQSPQLLIQGISYQPRDVVAAIDRMEPGEGRADLPATLRVVDEAITASIAAGWRGDVEVTLFSDLQESTWGAPLGQWMRDNDATNERSYRVVDCAGPLPASNLAVVRLDQQPTYGADPEQVDLLATISHLSGADAADDMLIQWVIDGVPRESTRVDLSPGESRSLALSATLGPGRHVAEVRIDASDAVAIDNIARRVLVMRSHIAVALFGPQPVDTRYLELAASPGGEGAIEVRRFDWDALGRTELERFDVWVLCNPPRPSDDVAERIDRHLALGGGVVWWLGPTWRPEAGPGANTAAVAEAEDDGAGRTWSARQVIDVTGGVIDPLDYRGAFIAPFEPFPGSGLLTLPIFRYWRLEFGEGWEAALGIRAGDASVGTDPLIATHEDVLEGRQVLVATPPGPGDEETPWNALIAWPAFVPLVQGMLHWSAGDQAESSNFVVGQQITGTSPEEDFAPRMVNRAGQVLETRVLRRQGQVVHWTAGVARHAGVYYWGGEADANRTAVTLEPVLAVDVNPIEGDLSRVSEVPPPLVVIDARDLGTIAADDSGTNASPSVAMKGSGQGSGPRGGQGGHGIGWWFLLAAIGVLVGESALVRVLEGRF